MKAQIKQQKRRGQLEVHRQHKNQLGASLVSWMVLAAAVTFVLVTIAKVAPIYVEFATVKSMVNEIAADDKVSALKNSRQLRRKLDDYMNINGLYTVKPEYFSVVKLPKEKNARALQVEYEVRKHWLANIDLTLNFHHAAPFKRQN